MTTARTPLLVYRVSLSNESEVIYDICLTTSYIQSWMYGLKIYYTV